MTPVNKQGANIVVIGGGTGSFTILQGLKNYTSNITALVSMADDGGSTGQLRDELGALPPGDVRQCLVALSAAPQVRDLFNYRFEEGSLKGHAFGNLFLTALEKMSGNFAEAVELASSVLKITGRVEPITLSNVRLCAEGVDGTPIIGECSIREAEAALMPRPHIWLEPEADASPVAVRAIMDADMVVIAPGHLYGSLAPALVIDGVQRALRRTKAKCVYVTNLVTKPGPTNGFTVKDFADEIERLVGGKFLDYVVFNNDTPSEELMKRYAQENEYAVSFNIPELKKQHYQFRAAPILARHAWGGAQSSDPLLASRSFIRHDSDAVARQLMRIYFT